MLLKKSCNTKLWGSIFVFFVVLLAAICFMSAQADAALSCAPIDLKPNNKTFYNASNKATLSWGAVPGATGYNVRLNSNSLERYVDPRYENCSLGNSINDYSSNYYCVLNVKQNSITDIPLLPDRIYVYTVEPIFDQPRSECTASNQIVTYDFGGTFSSEPSGPFSSLVDSTMNDLLNFVYGSYAAISPTSSLPIIGTTISPVIVPPEPTPEPDPKPIEIQAPQPEPLTVTATSSVVVMNFEPWFGPNAITFKDTYAKPFYTSENMININGGGYDSADPKIINEQARLIQELGADALLVDLTNNVDCIFDPKFCPADTDRERQRIYDTGAAVLKNNVSTLYEQINKLSNEGSTKLKIIPLIGGQTHGDFTIGDSGKTGIEMATDFFLNLQSKYPNLTVVYENRPLIVYYHGAAQWEKGNEEAWWEKTRNVIDPKYGTKITYRHMGGFFDDQQWNRERNDRVSAIKKGGSNSPTGFWTWLDRYNPQFGYYPSYNLNSSDGIEALTAAYAVSGKCIYDSTIKCWGTPPDNYDPDASLANYGSDRGTTFRRFMALANTYKPTFLFINQWNQYHTGDQGFDANTRNDIEPNTLVGYDNYYLVKNEILNYKRVVGSK
jgi:hypothetical protein